MRERAASIALIVFVVLTLANFAWLATERPAGSALSGRHEGDRYFLIDHSESHEVDGGTWEIRRAQEVLLLVSFPIVILIVKVGTGQFRRH
jgi:hypothetical protein